MHFAWLICFTMLLLDIRIHTIYQIYFRISIPIIHKTEFTNKLTEELVYVSYFFSGPLYFAIIYVFHVFCQAIQFSSSS